MSTTTTSTDSKHAQLTTFFRTGQHYGLSDRQIAARFGCDEPAVRRAMRLVEAEDAAGKMIEDGVSSEDAREVLKAILAADSLEDTLRTALQEIKEEEKEVKAAMKDAAAKARMVRKTARENHPLFDRPKGQGQTLAVHVPRGEAV